MAKAELGTKRVDPETGKKFYDLNKDPIVSPYTSISYPRSFFESNLEARLIEEDEAGEEIDTVLEKSEFISLDDADGIDKDDDTLPDLSESELHPTSNEDEDFLAADEDDDVVDIIVTNPLDDDS